MDRQFTRLPAIAALMMTIPIILLLSWMIRLRGPVVGVGGTRLTVNSASGAYGSESVWNDGQGKGAGGGGISGFWPIPSWQKNVSGMASVTHRNVPDVALNADSETGYAIYYNGQWTIYGGTSCAAPLWAAFTARVNQARLAEQQPVLGFANPSLYSISNGVRDYTSNFHDITSGNNLHYQAHRGYDNASGWGSFNGASLFASLTGSIQPPPPPPQLLPVLNIAVTQLGSSARGRNVTYTIAVSNQGNSPTSGAVNVAITLPAGLTYKSLKGSGWTCNGTTLICNQSSVLEIGSSYPPITLVAYVSRNVPRSVSLTATASGGGAAVSATATAVTTIK